MKNTHFLKLILCLSLTIILLESCNRASHQRRSHAGRNPKKEVRSSRTNVPIVTNAAKKTGASKRSREVVLREQIVESAKKMRGVAYKYGGKTPDTGFDCSGFTSYIYSNSGLSIAGPSYTQAKLGKRKEKDALVAGDLIFFGSADKISHVGIVTKHEEGILEVIHATNTSGVRIENILVSPYWKTRLLYGVDIITGVNDISMH